MKKHVAKILLGILLFTALPGVAPAGEFSLVLREYLQGLDEKIRAGDPGFTGFSAAAGREFFLKQRKHAETHEMRACSTCHTEDPSKQGQTIIGKSVDPLVPDGANQRFEDMEKVEKWFFRNCTWVLERECTDKEKGDFITYIFSL